MRRRQALAGIALLSSGSIAGCLGGGFNKHTHFTLESIDLSGIASTVTTSGPFEPDQVAAIQRSAREGVAITVDETLSEYVRVDGSYYRVVDVPYVVLFEETPYPAGEKSWPVLRVDRIEGASDAVSLDSYDESVAEFVRSVIDASTAGRPLPLDLAGNDLLTPKPRHTTVTDGGQQYRISISTREATAQSDAIRTVWVADSSTSFERHLDEEVLDIDPLSRAAFTETQRAIIQRAIDFRYEEEGSVSEDFQTVLDIVFEHGDWVDSDDTGGAAGPGPNDEAAVVYEGEMYLAETAKKTIASEL